jgi:hypothetical protein
VGDQLLVEQEPEPLVVERGMGLEPEGVCPGGGVGRTVLHDRPPPTRTVDHDGRGEPPFGRRHRARGEAGHAGLEEARARLSEQALAEDAVVEGAKRHGGEIVRDRAARRPDIEAIVDLQDARAHAKRLRHPERRSTRRRLHGSNLVPVDEQYVATELAGDGKATEARSNHDGVIVPRRHIELQHTAKPVGA